MKRDGNLGRLIPKIILTPRQKLEQQRLLDNDLKLRTEEGKENRRKLVPTINKNGLSHPRK